MNMTDLFQFSSAKPACKVLVSLRQLQRSFSQGATQYDWNPKLCGWEANLTAKPVPKGGGGDNMCSLL